MISFGPKRIEWLGAIATSSGFELYNPHSLNGGKPVLIAFVYENYAKELEDTFGTDTDAYQTDMTNCAMAVLRSMFGNSIPDPMLTKVTQWGRDYLAYDSYSFNKVGMSRNAREDMCTPVRNNRIFFAGEAWHDSLLLPPMHGEWPLLKIIFKNRNSSYGFTKLVFVLELNPPHIFSSTFTYRSVPVREISSSYDICSINATAHATASFTAHIGTCVESHSHLQRSH